MKPPGEAFRVTGEPRNSFAPPVTSVTRSALRVGASLAAEADRARERAPQAVSVGPDDRWWSRCSLRSAAARRSLTATTHTNSSTCTVLLPMVRRMCPRVRDCRNHQRDPWAHPWAAPSRSRRSGDQRGRHGFCSPSPATCRALRRALRDAGARIASRFPAMKTVEAQYSKAQQTFVGRVASKFANRSLPAELHPIPP